ncbi:MAG: hypothetical protein IAC08_02500 [Bacteroidetes bacterium]|uniref:BACON domain-containing protein n=1 Tax=Candidatus Cryptobacteroides intestinigallinarum TaxID=2840767 RepID=A0A9D9HK11_9BACT|nr:hypothetical protein [Candidatus Cryptobacteroides intestinigallinarum]
MTVTSSTDWTLAPKGTYDWVNASEAAGASGDVVTFTVSPNETQAERVAEFTFTAGTATATFKVTSTTGEGGGEEPDPSAERPVINMTDARLFPVAHTWANAAPLRNMSVFTLEAMICPKVLDKTSNSYESLSTIMGIEGKFIVRFGDSGIENHQIQVAAGNDKATPDMLFDLDKWYHVAVTFNSGEVTIYINGEKQITKSTTTSSVDFGMEHTNEPNGWESPRCFWIGYAYNTERDFQGLMAEVRIWNKVLTESDLKAEGHFYSVDPASDGLVAYWKMDEGEGTTVKDYTSNGNNLEGQYNLSEDPVGANTYNGTNVTGESKINWKTATLK